MGLLDNRREAKHKEADELYSKALEAKSAEERRALMDSIIKTGDAANIYWYARRFKDADIPKLQGALLKTKDAYYMHYFAKNIKGADVTSLCLAMAKCGSGSEIFKFARDVESADLNLLERAIYKSRDEDAVIEFEELRDFKGTPAYYVKQFSNRLEVFKENEKKNNGGSVSTIEDFKALISDKFKNADIAALNAEVAKSKNPDLIFNFAKYCEEADLNVLQGGLKNLAKDNTSGVRNYKTDLNKQAMSYIIKFAQEIEGANIDDLCAFVTENGTANDCYRFAKEVEGANIDNLCAYVAENGTAKDCYLFAKEIEGADIKSLQDAVLKSRDSTYVVEFAINIKGADIKPLQDFIIEKGIIRQIKDFAINVKGADVKALCTGLTNPSHDYGYYLEDVLELAEKTEGADIALLSKAVVAGITDNYCFKHPEKRYESERKMLRRDIYKFVNNNKEADLDAITDAFLKVLNANELVEFAREVEGVNHKVIAEAILNGQVEGAKNINLLEFFRNAGDLAPEIKMDLIANYGSAQEIYKFAKENEWADIDVLKDLILKTAKDSGDRWPDTTSDNEYILKFAQDIERLDQHSMCDSIIKTGNHVLMVQYSRFVKGEDLNKICDTIVKHNDPELIYSFAAMHSSEIDVEYLSQKMKESVISNKHLRKYRLSFNESAMFALHFARWVKGANIELMRDAIEAIGDAGIKYDFQKEFGTRDKPCYNTKSAIDEPSEVQTNDQEIAPSVAVVDNMAMADGKTSD